MTKAIDVLVVGSLHLDIVVKAQALPAIDETARGSSWHMVCGGKGGNQACWAARLGARTAMISRIGQDDFGNRLLANLREAGVNSEAVSIDPAKGSGMSVAIVQDNGDYGAVIVSGSNLTMKAEQVIASLANIGTPKVLVLQNEIDEAVNSSVAQKCRELGSTVILNAAPARELGRELASAIDVLVVNRVEAEMMSGNPVSSVATAIAALPQLQQLCKTVVVTLGGLGLVVAEAGHAPVVIEPIPITPVSTHGAGDCFIGRLAQALAHGASLAEACILANKTAASFVSGEKEWGNA